MPLTDVNESLMLTGIKEELPIVTASTTSRVVVNNEFVRTVYFSFDKGQLLTTHATPRAVVVTVLHGTIDFTLDDKTSTLQAGDCVYMAPNTKHSLVATSPAYMQLVMIDVTGDEQ